MSDDLIETAADLWRAVGAGEDLRLIGGLAVRAHVGVGARETRDVDVVAMTETVKQRVLDHLRSTGRAVGESGGWARDLVLRSGLGMPAAEIAARSRRDDSERAIARGANAARVELEGGGLSATFLEVMGRSMEAQEQRAVRDLLQALKGAGL